MWNNIHRPQSRIQLILSVGVLLCFCGNSAALGDNGGHLVTYNRQTLMDIRNQITTQDYTLLLDEIPIKSKPQRARKRGRKGGVRSRMRRRKHRVPVPNIMMGNVRSLRNKCDELSALSKFMFEYRESSMICLTETWLSDKDTDASVNIDGFTLIRSDRTEEAGKKCGGGVCMFVNDRWCKNITIKKKLCTPNVELMSASLRPFYLPREIPNIFCIVVYVPPSANEEDSVNAICEHLNDIENNCPDSLKLILGDFNHCSLNDALPNYHQVVNCNTRGDKTIDLCYSNIGNSYTSKCKPALGNSDHNMIHLIPTYRQKLKTDKPHTLEVQDWSENNIDLLKGCFECTDFNVLMSQNPIIDEQVICISDYIKFCSDTIIPTKQVKIYPNNKPWITKDLKSLLNKKKAILATKDKHKLREVQTEIKSAIYQAKLKYKQKMENMFNSNDTR